MSLLDNRIEVWNEKTKMVNRMLRERLPGATIDEVAVMFPSKLDMLGFIEECFRSKLEVKMFNSARDKVKTFPIASEYEVDYYFLEVKGIPYRVECMVLKSGLSPLHEAIKQQHRLSGTRWSDVTIHYSFKMFHLDTYIEAYRSLEKAEWTMAQGCRSTYGEFSYWIPGEMDTDWLYQQFGHHWSPTEGYIKPRVNTRDTVALRQALR